MYTQRSKTPPLKSCLSVEQSDHLHSIHKISRQPLSFLSYSFCWLELRRCIKTYFSPNVRRSSFFPPTNRQKRWNFKQKTFISFVSFLGVISLICQPPLMFNERTHDESTSCQWKSKIKESFFHGYEFDVGSPMCEFVFLLRKFSGSLAS